MNSSAGRRKKGIMHQGVEPNLNLNREPVKTAFLRWTRTEPEPFKFEIIEPEPNRNTI